MVTVMPADQRHAAGPQAGLRASTLDVVVQDGLDSRGWGRPVAQVLGNDSQPRVAVQKKQGHQHLAIMHFPRRSFLKLLIISYRLLKFDDGLVLWGSPHKTKRFYIGFCVCRKYSLFDSVWPHTHTYTRTHTTTTPPSLPLDYLSPSCRQTTVASVSSQRSSHTVPQRPPWLTSTRPAWLVSPVSRSPARPASASTDSVPTKPDQYKKNGLPSQNETLSGICNTDCLTLG